MNPSRFDLNLLSVLDVLLRERSVSRAATHLHLSQPAVSHALARAREAFGDPLLVREGSVMRPTPQAVRLAEPLSQALVGIRQLLQAARTFDPLQLQGEVRIGMSDYADYLLLPSLLEHLKTHAPGLRILSRDIHADQLADDLASGQIDMAISFRLANGAGFHERHLLSDRYACLAQKSTRSPMTLERYLSARHVQISYRGVFIGGPDEALARLGLQRTVAVFTPHVLAAAATAARAGLLLTTPERLARSLVQVFPLRMHALPLDLPPLELTLSWHARNDGDAAQRWLRDAIAAVAAEQGGPPGQATRTAAGPAAGRPAPRPDGRRARPRAVAR